jgi:hypothetical protein
VQRREFLAAGAGALAASAAGPFFVIAAISAGSRQAGRPRRVAIDALDESLLADYRQTFEPMKQFSFDNLCI